MTTTKPTSAADLKARFPKRFEIIRYIRDEVLAGRPDQQTIINGFVQLQGDDLYEAAWSTYVSVTGAAPAPAAAPPMPAAPAVAAPPPPVASAAVSLPPAEAPPPAEGKQRRTRATAAAAPAAPAAAAGAPPTDANASVVAQLTPGTEKMLTEIYTRLLKLETLVTTQGHENQALLKEIAKELGAANTLRSEANQRLATLAEGVERVLAGVGVIADVQLGMNKADLEGEIDAYLKKLPVEQPDGDSKAAGDQGPRGRTEPNGAVPRRGLELSLQRVSTDALLF